MQGNYSAVVEINLIPAITSLNALFHLAAYQHAWKFPRAPNNAFRQLCLGTQYYFVCGEEGGTAIKLIAYYKKALILISSESDLHENFS